jgi:acetoin utilization deacetylase AcuC-like enzyme
MRVGVVYDELFLRHDTGEHPENSKRLLAVVRRLQRFGLWDELVKLEPRSATPEELMLVHSREHIRRIRQMAEAGGGMADADTVISAASYETAAGAAGALISAVEAVIRGSVQSAFALVRPPGHHATRDSAMGFCLFNNLAIGAAHALEKLGLERVLILDWDVHRGNGTQSIFAAEPRVKYITIHQSPLYPGLSGEETLFSAQNIEVPLPPGCGENEYLRALEEIVVPAARLFKPGLIMLSAGYDAHWAEALAGMCLSISSYERMAQRVKALAEELCGGRLVLGLEGGYNLSVLAGGVFATLTALLGREPAEDALGPCPSAGTAPDISSLVAEIRARHSLS